MSLKVYIGKAARDRRIAAKNAESKIGTKIEKRTMDENSVEYKDIRVPADLDEECRLSFGDLMRAIEKVFPELSSTDRKRWNILMNELGYIERENLVSICKSNGLLSMDDFILQTDRISKAEKGKL